MADATIAKRARWYMQFMAECPLCGRDQSIKEARYSEPPEKEKRYAYPQPTACPEHFI